MELRLESSRRRQIELCPCGKSNKDGKFVPYAGYADKGYCHSCGQTFYPNGQSTQQPQRQKTIEKQLELPPFPQAIAEQNLNFNECFNNSFLLGLKLFFGWNVVKIAKKYNIGTFVANTPNDSLFNHYTIFLQRDYNGFWRQAKMMVYNPFTLKREGSFNTLRSIYEKIAAKHPSPPNEILQAATQQEACLFGEHLLRQYPKHKIALVESEKTAIIANEIGCFEDVLFLAVGGKNGYKVEKMKPIKNRQILVLPDNDVLRNDNDFKTIQNFVSCMAAAGYSIGIWSELPKLYSGEKADLADVLISSAAKEVWAQLVEFRDELTANNFTKVYDVTNL